MRQVSGTAHSGPSWHCEIHGAFARCSHAKRIVAATSSFGSTSAVISEKPLSSRSASTKARKSRCGDTDRALDKERLGPRLDRHLGEVTDFNRGRNIFLLVISVTLLYVALVLPIFIIAVSVKMGRRNSQVRTRCSREHAWISGKYATRNKVRCRGVSAGNGILHEARVNSKHGWPKCYEDDWPARLGSGARWTGFDWVAKGKPKIDLWHCLLLLLSAGILCISLLVSATTPSVINDFSVQTGSCWNCHNPKQ